MALTNTQYDEIMHDYEMRRAFHRDDQGGRIKYVEEHVPGFLELEQSTGSVSAEFGRRLIAGEKLSRDKLHTMLEEITNRKKQLLREAGLPEDFLEMHYDCPICKDTGYIGTEKCSCFKQKIIDKLYADSNIRKLTKDVSFSLLSDEFYVGEDLEHFHGALRSSKEFIKNFETSYPNLLFYGTVGTGKSFMSICIAKEILEKGHSVLYFSAAGLFTLIQTNSNDFKKSEELRTLYDDLYNSDLLIIDDLGTENITKMSVSQLFAIINERIIRNKSTLINTNLSLEGIKSIYSERITSRITSSYSLCKLSGPDIRTIKKMQYINGK